MGSYTPDVVIKKALSYEGYLEKKSNANLDSLTGNAGSNNYTRFARDYQKHTGIAVQGQPWCDTFVDECFIEAYGVERAKQMIGGFSAYTPTSANNYKKMGRWTTGRPECGYQIFFKNSSRICHTGLVVNVVGNTVYTCEGNTSSVKGVIANGGAVVLKSYPLNYKNIAGYGMPLYSTAKTTQNTSCLVTAASQVKANVKVVQNWINKDYGNIVKNLKICDCKLLVVDGDCGKKTVAALAGVLQYIIKTTGKTTAEKNLVVDGQFGDKTYKVCPYIKLGSSSAIVKIAEAVLYCSRYNPKEFQGNCTQTVVDATIEYQNALSLKADGMFGKDCFDAFLR